jgi:hypothetical protein
MLIHGNYCGPGNNAPLPPIDALDAACARHDACTPDGALAPKACNLRLQVDAERLAEKCLERDRAPDWRDMHACIECKHLQYGGRCAATKRDALPKEIFHRCHSFGWQMPRTQGQA